MKLIVAIDNKNGIGKYNTIPWYIKEELKYFKKITSHTTDFMKKNVVIMGRNTWESIPDNNKPLSNRINIVLTSNEHYFKDSNYKDTYSVSSLEEALTFINQQFIANNENIFIIGGEKLYKEAMEHPLCSHLYITEIYETYDCDKYFPKITENFKLNFVSNFKNDNTTYYRNLVYTNINNMNIEFSNLWNNKEEYQYLYTLKKILNKGIKTEDRTGVGTLSIFGEMFKYDLENTFPLLTTKRMFVRGIFEELMFYLSGKTDNKILKNKNVNIWNDNTSRDFLDKRGLTHYPEDDMGETYGFNFRHYGAEYKTCKEDYTGQGFDQLKYAIDLIKNNPSSRRIIIDIWNYSTLDKASLPPCLCKYQFNVDQTNNKLNLMIYIRSSDFFLANNWNVCTGAFLVHMICNLNGVNLTPGILTVVTGDTHLYLTHIDAVNQNLNRTPKPFPKLVIKEKKDNIEDFEYSDMNILGYKPYPNIPAKMAI